MKIALVHDWLTGMRGGEKVLEIFCELYPKSTLFTLVHKKNSCSDIIERMEIKTSFLQKFPNIEKNYRNYLILMPKAVESFNLSGFSLILSSSHCVAKGVKKDSNALHISYVHTPMRYVWDMYDEYIRNVSFFQKYGLMLVRKYLQNWDKKSSSQVDYFIANSQNIKDRIKKHYNRDAVVIYPPVDTEFFVLSDTFSKKNEEYYLVVSAFVQYKKVDLVIGTFNKLGYRLKIIGDGPMEKKLKSIAKNNIEFLGWVNNEKLRFYYQHAKALIFPQEEDFGITSVEAQSCGTPVVGIRKGGVMETVIENVTGVFFEEQTIDSLSTAIEKFNKINFNPQTIRQNAITFSKEKFKKQIFNFVEEKIKNL